MKSLFRTPTRDANDADHLAIMLFFGAIYLLVPLEAPMNFSSPWFITIVLSLITAPLLWIRFPYAKWGGFAASLILAYLFIKPLLQDGFSIRQGFACLGICAMSYWFFIIDYCHRFADEN